MAAPATSRALGITPEPASVEAHARTTDVAAHMRRHLRLSLATVTVAVVLLLLAVAVLALAPRTGVLSVEGVGWIRLAVGACLPLLLVLIIPVYVRLAERLDAPGSVGS
ncbi:hypothetical protein Nans01_04090 [Nocardiopsis ansamitocini]|uniref:Uncharacterized protein n=1 Tax=Nocardiopsis ansamitocini TaxID=1670832 RepID=A0A9W6P2Y5_9ACTN|nr:hypothetical protein Nans01_04090 [Nocardiopsis ansamitocini]